MKRESSCGFLLWLPPKGFFPSKLLFPLLFLDLYIIHERCFSFCATPCVSLWDDVRSSPTVYYWLIAVKLQGGDLLLSIIKRPAFAADSKLGIECWCSPIVPLESLLEVVQVQYIELFQLLSSVYANIHHLQNICFQRIHFQPEALKFFPPSLMATFHFPCFLKNKDPPSFWHDMPTNNHLMTLSKVNKLGGNGQMKKRILK